MYRFGIYLATGTVMGAIGFLTAAAAWPHDCLEYAPFAAVLGALGGSILGWFAGSLVGTDAVMSRWGPAGSIVGGFFTGFFYYCATIQNWWALYIG